MTVISIACQQEAAAAAIVRKAAPAEHATIAALLLRANREFKEALPARIYDAYLHDLHELAAATDGPEFMVAECAGHLVGAVAFYREAGREGWGLPQEWAGMRALAVDPKARGRGIGRQLAEACVLRAWRIGRRVIALHNCAFQQAARRLYLTMGFVRCPQFDFDAGDLPDLDLKGERLAIDAFCLDLKR